MPDFVTTRAHRQGSDLVPQWTGGKPPYQVYTLSNVVSGVWYAVGSATTNTNATVLLPKIGMGVFRVSNQP